MPQFTIKLNSYDPAIVEAFERLRKSRKQAAFTHEALKYFLASEKGVQVIQLMSRDHLPSIMTARKQIILSEGSALTDQATFREQPSRMQQDYCSHVVEKILK